MFLATHLIGFGAKRAAAAGITGTTLNPSDKGTGATLSGGNLTCASPAGTWAGARSVSGKTSGLYYFEATPLYQNYCCIGVCTSSYDLNTSANSSTAQWGAYFLGSASGIYSDNGSDVGGPAQAFLLSYSSPNRINVAFNRNTGKVWFGRNGTFSGNPAAGTGEAFSGITGTIYAYVMPFGDNSSEGAASVTVNFGGSAFSDSVPSGFTAGWPA